MEMGLCSRKNLFPFMGMVIAVLAVVSNMEAIKATMSKGMNKYVLIVYSDALSTLIFLLCSLIIHRSDRPLLTFSIICRSVFGSVQFKMEKLSWRSKISLAKSLGTMVSIAGAFVVTLYEGPTIITTLSGNVCVLCNYPLLPAQSNWIIGGIFLAAVAFLESAWLILQVGSLFPSQSSKG